MQDNQLLAAKDAEIAELKNINYDLCCTLLDVARMEFLQQKEFGPIWKRVAEMLKLPLPGMAGAEQLKVKDEKINELHERTVWQAEKIENYRAEIKRRQSTEPGLKGQIKKLLAELAAMQASAERAEAGCVVYRDGLELIYPPLLNNSFPCNNSMIKVGSLLKTEHPGAALTAELERLRERFTAPIVCMCGSTRFMGAWNDWRKRLTLEGNIILSIELVTTQTKEADPQYSDRETKIKLDDLHKRKIDLCDWVWVLDVGGYIGESTKSEIEYAHSLGRPIRYLSKELPDYVEPKEKDNYGFWQKFVENQRVQLEDRIENLGNDLAAARETIKRLRGALEQAENFIANLRVPQNTLQSAFQINDVAVALDRIKYALALADAPPEPTGLCREASYVDEGTPSDRAGGAPLTPCEDNSASRPQPDYKGFAELVSWLQPYEDCYDDNAMLTLNGLIEKARGLCGEEEKQ